MIRSAALVAVALGVLALAGCSVRPGANKGSISFAEIFEDRQGDEFLIERTFELDVDGDQDDEWLVSYRYDPTIAREWRNTPIQGIVYDAIPCDPPIIHHWRLPSPDNDYLGEGDTVSAFMADWLDSSGVPTEAEDELVIVGEGPVNTLSIYRFHDRLQNPCLPPDDTRQGFSLLGFFRANGPIIFDEDTDTVTSYRRTEFERSQLAIRSTYAPRVGPIGESFVDDQGRTRGPDEQSVDFLYGIPISPVDSPYPEKAVAAFYLSLGRDNERAASWLADPLQADFLNRTWGLDVTPDQLSRVLVYSVAYTPDRQAELLHQDREVTVVVAAVDLNNQRYPARRVTWRLVGIPIFDRPDCEWRLAEIRTVNVTEGLGGALAPPAERRGSLVP